MAAKPGDGGYSSEALLKSQLVVLGDRFSPDENRRPEFPQLGLPASVRLPLSTNLLNFAKCRSRKTMELTDSSTPALFPDLMPIRAVQICFNRGVANIHGRA
jgi:hypothetical protein